jgi:peptidoglycan/LPS O-acetylase OafA/YrhL
MGETKVLGWRLGKSNDIPRLDTLPHRAWVKKVTRPEIKTITALRFVAALMVFVTHVTHLPGLETRVLDYFALLGLSLFFTLSGFIMAYSYWDPAEPGGLYRGTWTFYLARLAKIYPLHWICFFLALPLGLYSPTSPVKPSSILVHFFLVADFFPWHDFGPRPNQVTWTLECEMVFYALTPLLFAFLAWAGRWGWMGLGVFFIWWQGWALPGWSPVENENAAVARLVEYVAGMGLYEWYRRVGVSWARWSGGFVLAGVILDGILYYYFSSHPLRLTWNIWLLPGSLLILWGAMAMTQSGQDGWIGRPWLWLGRASYAFYLVHELILRYGRQVMLQIKIDWSFSEALGWALLFGLGAQGLALWLHWKIERPAQRWGRVLAYRFFAKETNQAKVKHG